MKHAHTLALIALLSLDIPCVNVPLSILYGGKLSRRSVSQHRETTFAINFYGFL